LQKPDISTLRVQFHYA
jgi:hypothetical protein